MPTITTTTYGWRIYRYGDRGSGFRLKRNVQDFAKLRQKCLDEGVLFEDPQFPAEDASLYFSRSPPVYIEWKRPHVSRTTNELSFKNLKNI
ncbi:calpain-A-like [Centruroides sculpturatus]|uniref:calpain-A-like n=1 Tax=Centruroides sculpturatus TaxID=218467 RepID=UPI000C6E4625|nr:calpain-A-like [Centruroides sculpturatus]